MRIPALSLPALTPLARADDTAWPPVTREAKSWTRWWWLGSGVDAANLTRQLQDFSNAGLGGGEICPIYGEGEADTVARVRADDRETTRDLHRDYLAKWHDWAKQRGSLTRNPTHGSPGNLLDLGGIAHTAKVRLNGKPAGTCWAPPHRLPLIGLLEKGKNVLQVEVTNLAANRIADLDRRKVEWKAFHEINFVNIDYKPFDASVWPALPSGLLGPLKLIPLR